jgi:serine/threonine protein kinase
VPFTVKLLDFGIATLTQRHESESLGTPLWIAPEQLDASRDPTPASDVWSLGLVVYAMLTGRSYWTSAGMTDGLGSLVREVLIDLLPPASARAAEQGVLARLPRGFDGWFAACVTRDPERRFRSASIAGAAFADLLRAAAAPPRTPSYPALVAPPRVEPSGVGSSLFVGVSLAIFFVSLVASLAWSGAGVVRSAAGGRDLPSAIVEALDAGDGGQGGQSGR